MRKRERTDIGQRLVDWMTDNPMTIVEVAKLIEISPNSVLSIARGATEPRNKVRCKIDKFLKEQKNAHDTNSK